MSADRSSRGVLQKLIRAGYPDKPNECWLWPGTTTHKGYGLVDFTPTQLTTTLRVVDDVTRRDTRIETLARFVVSAGQPVIERG